MRSSIKSLWLVWIGLLGATAWGQGLQDPIPEPIEPASTRIGLTPVAEGLTAPNSLVTPRDGSDRLFVTDQTGEVRVIGGDSQLQSDPFLDVSDQIVDLNPAFDERGLLGMAFHPGFDDPTSEGHKKFYTYTSEPVGDNTPDFAAPLDPGQTPDHHSVVREWTMNDQSSNTFSGESRELMRIEQPQFNHNGGNLAFGPDNDLYIGLGDGGAADDQGPGHSPQGNAQTKTNVLGSMLRIDPLGDNSANGAYGIPAANPFTGSNDGVDEIFATGLRNPFRFSFDSESGDLIIGDVGQNDIEEINRIDPEEDAGANFGWRVKEGTFKFNTGNGGRGFVTENQPGTPETLNGDPVIDPIAQYDQDEGISVIAGFVYNGSNVPRLEDQFIFGDFLKRGLEGPGGDRADTGRLFISDLDELDPDTGLAEIRELLIGDEGRPLNLSLLGVGQGPDGELFVLGNSPDQATTGNTGRVFQIVPEPGTLSIAGLLVSLGITRRRRHARL